MVHLLVTAGPCEFGAPPASNEPHGYCPSDARALKKGRYTLRLVSASGEPPLAADVALLVK